MFQALLHFKCCWRNFLSFWKVSISCAGSSAWHKFLKGLWVLLSVVPYANTLPQYNGYFLFIAIVIVISVLEVGVVLFIFNIWNRFTMTFKMFIKWITLFVGQIFWAIHLFLDHIIYKQHDHITLHTPFHWLMFNWVNTDDLHSDFTVYTTKQWHSTPHILTGKMNYSVVLWCWLHNSMELMFREIRQTKVMLSS
jgi:hypothetical protein